ncbi:mariner Mos1 transposase [Trichonephila clavipes]|nr:mariner Mos1 transposase [Trichonephila clavipes]
MEWRHTSSPVKVKAKQTLSKRKIMITEFWDQYGVLLLGFMTQGTTINSGAYCATLRKSRRALQNKRHDMLSKGVLLLHDNARPHTSQTTRELIESFGWEVLDPALYSPDLASSDFHLFQYLKHSLGGKRFSDNEEVKAAVNSLLFDPAADFFEKGFQNLVLRWRKEKKFKSLPNGDLNFTVPYIDNYESNVLKTKSSAPVVVAIHGAPGTCDDFDGLASYLQQKARIVVPTFPDFSIYEPGVFRFSAEEKAQFLKDFLAKISVSHIDALVVHSSGIYPALRLCFDESLTIKSLIMLNVGTYTFDMKATKHIKTLRKMTAASENPVLLKILQIIAPTLIKMAKLPVRIDNIMDTLLSATTMVYADAPQAKEKFIQLSLKGIPIFYAFSKDDKLIGDKCCYDLAYLLGASDADIYSYDKNGMIMHAGKKFAVNKLIVI